jgi:hypothetical protein
MDCCQTVRIHFAVGIHFTVGIQRAEACLFAMYWNTNVPSVHDYSSDFESVSCSNCGMGLNIPHSHISDSKVCRFIALGFTPPPDKDAQKGWSCMKWCLFGSTELLNRTLYTVLLIAYHGLLGSTPASVLVVLDSNLGSAMRMAIFVYFLSPFRQMPE